MVFNSDASAISHFLNRQNDLQKLSLDINSLSFKQEYLNCLFLSSHEITSINLGRKKGNTKVYDKQNNWSIHAFLSLF